MLKLLQFPLELILAVVLAYVIFRLFCRLANSPRFSRTLKRAGGTPDTDEALIESVDAAEAAARERAAANEADINQRIEMQERLNRRVGSRVVDPNETTERVVR